MAAPPANRVLLLLFPNVNTLDVNGPLEVLRKSGSSEHFEVTIASETLLTKTAEGAILQRHIALDKDLISRDLANYDVLVVPGGDANGPDSAVQKLANNVQAPFMQLIRAYASLRPRSDPNPRILTSVCTGAIFLAKLGVFNGGRMCTTHWMFYNVLNDYNKAAATKDAKPGHVVPARYVDSGLTQNQIRIITSGGISSGIDAALHVVLLRVCEDEARTTAEVLDYDWKKTVGVQLDAFK